MNDERYKQIMKQLGQDNSMSLLIALKQVANEVGQEYKSKDLDKFTNSELIKELIRRNGIIEAPKITKRAGKHFESIVEIDKDNCAHVTITDDTLALLK